MVVKEKTVTFDDYQAAADRTVNYSLSDQDRVVNALLGIYGEIGEAIDAFKKHFFQGHDLDAALVAEEIGDALWYISLLSRQIGISLSEIAQGNIDKLERRYGGEFSAEKSKNRSQY